MEVLKPPRIHLNRDIVRISPSGIPVVDLNPKPMQEKKHVAALKYPPRIHLNRDIVFIRPGKPPRISLNAEEDEQAA